MILAHFGELHQPGILGLIPLAITVAIGALLSIIKFFKRFK